MKELSLYRIAIRYGEVCKKFTLFTFRNDNLDEFNRLFKRLNNFNSILFNKTKEIENLY